MAAGIELPKQVIVHSHWLCDGFKMSKSLGNVVDPMEISEYYGVDPVRFSLLKTQTSMTIVNSVKSYYKDLEMLFWENIVT